MVPIIDLEKEYGLVLEGGGAKGAYQIGAWKALKEVGVKIKGVAGTSVGALNGALICMGDYEKAETLWKEISYSKIMDVDDVRMGQLFQGDLSLREAMGDFLKTLGDGGADITPLKELIAENIDEAAVKSSGIAFFVLTFSVSEMKELDIDIKEVEDGLMQDILLASAYVFPLFKNEKLHGKKYIDGGIINNVPLGSLVKRGYKDIIQIRIFGIGRERKVKLEDDVTILDISPRVNLGNIMDFNSKKSIRNMKIGYYDAMRTIYGLQGKIYYIEQNEEEWYYLNQLLSIAKEVKGQLMELYKLDKNPDMAARNYLEVILPAIASDLKLGKEWTYSELYVTILEATAKILRVQKYNIYTVQKLLEEVKKRVGRLKEMEEVPAFVLIILNRNCDYSCEQ